MRLGQHAADQARRGVKGGQRDAGDGGRQGEGQVDQGVDDVAAKKPVADQGPGVQHAEHAVDGGGGQAGGAERQGVGVQRRAR